MELADKDSKNNILFWAKRLYQRGMSPSVSGNISVKHKDGILISASGTCMNDMDENDVVFIDYDGNLKEGNKKPSSEKIMHSEIYTRRDDINAIIHCHCPLITAFAVAGLPIKKPILPDFALYWDEIPLIPYYCPSSTDLAVAVGECFEKNNVALLKNHGVVLGDTSLQNAFYKLDLLRAYVEIYFGAEVLGGAMAIPKKGVSEIKKLYRK